MEKFISRKFVVALLYFGLEVAVGAKILEIPEESLDGVRTVAIAYLTGQSFVDSVLSWKQGKV